jgi:phenylpyruvate tautomerase PptA (4-oxalocrotonate tautomerase family)
VPIVNISLLSGWSAEDRRKISDEVHAALVETFKIPDSDYTHRVPDYTKDEFIVPGNRSGRYALIEITALAGRSREAKKKLYRSIVDRLGKFGIDPNDTMIVINEPTKENWGINGGHSADEVDLGYKLDV